VHSVSLRRHPATDRSTDKQIAPHRIQDLRELPSTRRKTKRM
jgi:hypothetical protein